MDLKISEWRQAMEVRNRGNLQHRQNSLDSCLWQTPESGFWKCNVYRTVSAPVSERGMVQSPGTPPQEMCWSIF